MKIKYVTNHFYTPILADESVFSAEDAIHIIQERAADLINIKRMRGPVCEGSRIRMNNAWEPVSGKSRKMS